MAAGAVTIVDVSPAPELESLEVRLERREFQDSDVVGAWLVIVATGDEVVDDKVERAATEAGVWVNRAHKPDGGGIAFGAVIENAGR